MTPTRLRSQAPLDNLRKLQKTTAKSYEYNMSQLEKELEQALVKSAKAASTSSSQLDPEERQAVLKSVESMLSRMRGLKRKLVELEKQTETTNLIVKTRLDHLEAVPPTLEDPSYPAWAKKRLSHHLVDYMLRSSPPLLKSAQVLAKEENVEDLVDKELWDEMGKVEIALSEQKLDHVLSWVGENRTALKKLKVRSDQLALKVDIQSDPVPVRSYSLLSNSRSTSNLSSNSVDLGLSLKLSSTLARTWLPRVSPNSIRLHLSLPPVPVRLRTVKGRWIRWKS
jgi:hypothetical protein